jgi:DNA-nicking Smr family endonuclease
MTNSFDGSGKTKASRKKRQLHPEEEALWQQVRKTVQPVSTRQNLKHWLDNEPHEDQLNSPSAFKSENNVVVKKTTQPSRQFIAADYSPPVSLPVPTPKFPSSIDDKTAKKLIKGKQLIDARIDLHGMSQDIAHRILQDFVFHQYHSGSKIVLVITGKGRMHEGILRNAVPRWLREPHLSEFVSAFRISHISHGGEGALYVRLRNKNRTANRKMR